MLGIQVAFTVFIAVFINRRLLLQNVALRNQLGVYLRTIDKNKLKSHIRDRDRRLGMFKSQCLLVNCYRFPKTLHCFVVLSQRHECVS